MGLLKSLTIFAVIEVICAGHLHGGSSYSVFTKHDAPHYGNSLTHGIQGADYAQLGKYYEHQHYEPVHYPKYSFDYGVKDTHTGDQKSQWEHRDGDHVKGGYTLKEADGTTRIVEYTADDHSGFNAVVKHTGHAYHPQVYQKVESYGHAGDLHSIGGYGYGLASSYANVKQHL